MNSVCVLFIHSEPLFGTIAKRLRIFLLSLDKNIFTSEDNDTHYARDRTIPTWCSQGSDRDILQKTFPLMQNSTLYFIIILHRREVEHVSV